MIARHESAGFRVDYGAEIETEIDNISKVVDRHAQIVRFYDARWLAIQLLEGVEDLTSRVAALDGGEEVLNVTRRAQERLGPTAQDGVDIAIADRRYTFVSRVVADVLRCSETITETLSERIDRVVTHPWLSIPIFFLVMYLLFNLVVNVSTPYLDWIDNLFCDPVTRWIGSLLALLRAPAWLQGLLLDGVIAGVGSVLVFIPGLFMLFLSIGFLEDSGYLARAAVVMDRFMNVLGLRGKSFVPMILGFGCAVPAIYATRTLESRRDRILTTLLVPLMSCSARMPVYVLFGLAFFGRKANWVLWGLYALGILVAAVFGVIFSRTLLKRADAISFVIELPAYSLPSIRSLWGQVSMRMHEFVRNAGTVILAASIIIWLLLNIPLGATDLSESWFGLVSNAVVPILRPAGFGNWESAGSLISGLVAKEVVVSTMSEIYVGEDHQESIDVSVDFVADVQDIGLGFLTATVDAGKELLEVLTPGINLFPDEEDTVQDSTLRAALIQALTPLSALAFLVFVLLYVPCVATLGTIRSEFGWRWALFAAGWQTCVAWLTSVLVFQLGRLFGFA